MVVVVHLMLESDGRIDRIRGIRRSVGLTGLVPATTGPGLRREIAAATGGFGVRVLSGAGFLEFTLRLKEDKKTNANLIPVLMLFLEKLK